ncbi:MAG: hypothetical protein Q9160_001963 [Pyrenula sp. 1 TL-2023]
MASILPSTSLTSLLTILLSPIFFAVLWHLSTTSSQFSSTHLRGKRICLLIAHPDDEAMFFSPTVIALTNPHLGNHVKILCLSTGTEAPFPPPSGCPLASLLSTPSHSATRLLTRFSGNADGLGSTRKSELIRSALHLGLRKPSDVFIIDDPARFPDSMSTTWSASEISSLLSSAFVPSSPSSTNTSTSSSRSSTKKKKGSETEAEQPPTATIDTLITFDRSGISHHPNHISLHSGALDFLRTLMRGREAWRCPVDLYTLTTTSLLRKYTFVMDAPVTMIVGAVENLFLRGKGKKGKGREEGERLLFVSGLREYWRGRGAMVNEHRSQMVWFRWGWVAVGRYMVVNDLKREGV